VAAPESASIEPENGGGGIEPASVDAPTGSVHKLRLRLKSCLDGWFATNLPAGQLNPESPRPAYAIGFPLAPARLLMPDPATGPARGDTLRQV